MAVQDELWFGGGARREIQQQRISGACLAVRDELGRSVVTRLPGRPAGSGATDRNPRVIAGKIGEFAGIVGAGNDMADPAAGKAVEKIVSRQQCRRGDNDSAEFHRRQHAFP